MCVSMYDVKKAAWRSGVVLGTMTPGVHSAADDPPPFSTLSRASSSSLFAIPFSHGRLPIVTISNSSLPPHSSPVVFFLFILPLTEQKTVTTSTIYWEENTLPHTK